LDLSIIIVNYNVKEFLQNLIHSIEKASSTITKEIIIIDNASDDGSVDFIKEKFPYVKLTANQKNQSGPARDTIIENYEKNSNNSDNSCNLMLLL